MQKSKTFCYVSLGILALALAFHLGARSARASYVPPGETGIVGLTGAWGEHGGPTALLDSGQLYWWHVSHVGEPGEWIPEGTIPVPVSDVRFFEATIGAFMLVTRSSEVLSTPLAVVFVSWDGETWISAPSPPPGGPIATEPSTWGAVKARFSRD